MPKVCYRKTIRVYYEDTDAGGVVYHSKYLNFMERCRSDWMVSLGYPVDQIEKNFDVMFAVRHVELDFILPAKLFDELNVELKILQLGKVRMQIQQDIYNQDDLLASARIKLATLDSTSFTLTPLPDPISRSIRAILS